MAMQPSDAHLTWGQFRTAFRANFILAGLLDIKLEEFLRLRQGNKSVLEYTNLFNHLSQYAAVHVDTDPKKRSCYLRRLNDKMQDKLSTSSYADFNELVSLAIRAEGRNWIYKEGKKNEGTT